MEINREAILQNFLVEAREIFEQIEQGLVSLENQPGDEEVLQMIFRGAHTLKGNAVALGLNPVTELSHTLEDLLERLCEKSLPVSPELITALLRVLDVLRESVPSTAAGREETTVAERECLRLLNGFLSGTLPETRVQGAPPPHADAAAARFSSDAQTLWQDSARTLRVGIEKVDRMLTLAGEVAIASARLRQMLSRLDGRHKEEILETHRDAERLFMELQEQVIKLRMVPVEPLFRQHTRTVRDLARKSGKQAQLVIEGGEVEVDTSVTEHLRAPLTHMLRNAIDHGLETPQVRKARGKDPCGRITLRAYHDAGNIVIQVADDGAGLSRERILERARAQGLIPDAEKVSEQELYRLIFEPGFSTADTVTDLSGRGIGMDVVRRNIEALRGSVNIQSQSGQGTTITIRLPLTLAIIEGFSVSSGGEIYIIPLDAVLQCVELPPGEDHSEGVGVISLRGDPLPYVRLRHLFALPGEPPARENVVVVQHEGGKVGITVDVLGGECQVVIKPLGKLFQACPGLCGSTIVGNGRVALILDVPSLISEVMQRQFQAVG